MAGNAAGVGRRHGLLAVTLILLAWLGWWWINLPRTPREYFEVRCSTCHELPLKELCKRSAPERAPIVKTMRSLHGADEVISDEEALIIVNYLEESFQCP